MPRIPALWEAETGGAKVPAQTEQFNGVLRPCLKTEGPGFQLSGKALSLIPSTAKKKKISILLYYILSLFNVFVKNKKGHYYLLKPPTVLSP